MCEGPSRNYGIRNTRRQHRPEVVVQGPADALRGELLEAIHRMHIMRCQFNAILSEIEFLGLRIEAAIEKEEPK